MSVTGSFRVDTRPYTAYADPGLPVASWIGQSGSVGDASGGTMLIDFEFQLEAEPISELFNLEQLSIDIDDSANADVMMSVTNMDSLSPSRVASPQKWAITLDGLSPVALGGSAINLDELVGLPLWLGSPNNITSASSLRFLMDNVDLRLYAITVQGYMWGPRSILAPGGPQRPISGLFRG